MKICGTCQAAVEDQAEICPRCGMKMGPYEVPDYSKEHYVSFLRWTLFPPIPKTHWWGTELTSAPLSQQVEHGPLTSSSFGVFAKGPTPGLNLGIGLYEFHCLLLVGEVPRDEQTSIATIRVLRNDVVIAERWVKGEDFQDQ